MRAVIILIAAYLIGGIPWSYYVSRWAGADLHRLGDGNIGAHNVMRHVGRAHGWLALLLDASKGALAVALALSVSDAGSFLPVAAGWLTVLGHNYSPWLGLSGGKGLATGLGVVLALLPRLAWLTLGVALIVIAITKNLAFSGVVVGLVLALAALLGGYGSVYTLAPLGLLMVMAIKQVPDLHRMWRAASNKRDLILNRWIIDREAKL